MGKAFGNEELTMVLSCQFHGDMLSERRTSLPDINRHVQYATLNDAHELALAIGRILEMQSSQHTVVRI